MRVMKFEKFVNFEELKVFGEISPEVADGLFRLN